MLPASRLGHLARAAAAAAALAVGSAAPGPASAAPFLVDLGGVWLPAPAPAGGAGHGVYRLAAAARNRGIADLGVEPDPALCDHRRRPAQLHERRSARVQALRDRRDPAQFRERLGPFIP